MQAGLAQATTAVNGVSRGRSAARIRSGYRRCSADREHRGRDRHRAREGKNRFEIRLDPAELGRIDVRLDIDRQGNVTSRLLVERADTLDLLRRDLSNLERALNDAGLKTGQRQPAIRHARSGLCRRRPAAG